MNDLCVQPLDLDGSDEKYRRPSRLSAGSELEHYEPETMANATKNLARLMMSRERRRVSLMKSFERDFEK